MSELTADRFSEFFQALWGRHRRPFAWQQDLVTRILENPDNPWPEAIALPTASGKTACLDIAVYALAARTGRSLTAAPLSAPRRIFFVVDRRVVVDEAYDRARRLARKLRETRSGILLEVADGLRVLGGGENPLACFQLRGGIYRSDAWAKSPIQPAIIASTVDQLGSRLLFRAYGSSFKAWPIQAGLAGNDVLVLLDEAHCAVPFLETLRAVHKFRGWAEQPLKTPFHVTIMSATPPEGVSDVFRDTSGEPRMPEHPLGARQMAKKPAYLHVQTRATGLRALEELARGLAQTAEELCGGRPFAVVVFTNRVATARSTHRLLAQKYGNCAILLTGRMRPLDKDDTLVERLKILSADESETRQLKSPVFVVATQTLEVGANLDFDALVTECASLDALRQRFGRLNRAGRRIETRAAILIRADQAKNSEDDPVYGAALADTWQWLKEQAGENDEIDMGITGLEECLPNGKALARLNAPTIHAPVMLPAHVDCWVQTAPEPMPTPDVSVFLHGNRRASADVQLCWRSDIDLNAPDRALESLALCPPAVGECLPVPIGFLRRWLQGEEPSPGMVVDVEGAIEEEDNERAGKPNTVVRRVVLWRGPDEAQVITDSRTLRPGDVVVIPSALGGWDVLGDLLKREGELPVLDWGDRAHVAARAKGFLRLHPAVVGQWPDFESKPSLLELAAVARTLFDDDPDTLLSALRDVLGGVAEDESTPESMKWLMNVAESMVRDPGLKRGIILHPSGEGIVVRGTRRLPMPDDDLDSFTDENDSSASGTVQVGLASHLEGVAEFARRFASGCGLPIRHVESVSCAGLLHDPGKADPRFQALLQGGNPWARGELLAKSGDVPPGRAAYSRACEAAGYPAGGRHELLSVRLVQSASELLPHDEDLQELVLHLVGSHHGYCRPFAPVVFDDNPAEIALDWRGRRMTYSGSSKMERLDSGVPERFWSLTRRYGWWGLAYLEAILRLADHRRSEWEETNS